MWTQGRHVQTTRRRRDDCVDCVAPFPHIMDTIGPFIRLEAFLIMVKPGEHGLGVERQESATTLQ